MNWYAALHTSCFTDNHCLCFFTFYSIPYSLRVSLTFSMMFCSSDSLSLTKTASSSYLKLLQFCPPVSIPLTLLNTIFLKFLHHIFMYKLKSIGEIICTPLHMEIHRDFPAFVLMTACWLQDSDVNNFLSSAGMPLSPLPSPTGMGIVNWQDRYGTCGNTAVTGRISRKLPWLQ